MKTQAKPKVKFADLPKAYAALCQGYLPRPIHDQVGYDNTVEIADALAGFEESFSPDQADYFDLLCTLIEAYDKERVKWPEVTPLETLKFIMGEHGLSAADLSRILGVSRNLGAMILRGERSITAGHARSLGKHFSLPAGTFVEGAELPGKG